MQDKVDQFGGQLITGWAIWETQGVFIEAEFHAVWLKIDGEYVDLNPRDILSNITEIIFVPESIIMYKNKQIDNIRKALIDDNKVLKYLHLNKKLFELTNRGNRAYQHGSIEFSKKESTEFNKIDKEIVALGKFICKKYEVD